MKKSSQMIPMRLSPELANWAAEFAAEATWLPTYGKKTTRTGLVRELLQAVRDRRVIIASEPAPHLINDGSDPAMPVLVCPNPK